MKTPLCIPVFCLALLSGLGLTPASAAAQAEPPLPQGASAPASAAPATNAPAPASRAGRGPVAPAPQSVSPRDAEPWTPSDFNALKPGLPSLIIAGDSTADKGPDAWHRGWAAVLNDYFDQSRINLVNRARGGRSARSFVREGLWDQLIAAVKPGDIVVIQFGHNDGGDINHANGRPDLPGLGEEIAQAKRPEGTEETVHTFGWYLRKFVAEVRARGATPVLMSTTVYNRWPNGIFSRAPSNVNTWIQAVAEQEKVPLLDHTNIIGDRYEQLGEAAVKPFFPADFLHTSTPGAVVNAEMFVAGMKTLGLKPLTDALNAAGQAIAAYRPRPVAPVAAPVTSR